LLLNEAGKRANGLAHVLPRLDGIHAQYVWLVRNAVLRSHARQLIGIGDRVEQIRRRRERSHEDPRRIDLNVVAQIVFGRLRDAGDVIVGSDTLQNPAEGVSVCPAKERWK
jgi:hypothetical protein